jgi:hypothetical protein
MASQTADANPGRFLHWSFIRWTQVKETVRRLQARIVKALKQGAFRKVKDLQRLLIRSLSGRLLAVERVTSKTSTEEKHSMCILKEVDWEGRNRRETGSLNRGLKSA